MVDAVEMGCRGRELRKVGESFGGGADIYAFKRVLPLVAMVPGGRLPEVPLVGVFALAEVVLA